MSSKTLFGVGGRAMSYIANDEPIADTDTVPTSPRSVFSIDDVVVTCDGPVTIELPPMAGPPKSTVRIVNLGAAPVTIMGPSGPISVPPGHGLADSAL